MTKNDRYDRRVSFRTSQYKLGRKIEEQRWEEEAILLRSVLQIAYRWEILERVLTLHSLLQERNRKTSNLCTHLWTTYSWRKKSCRISYGESPTVWYWRRIPSISSMQTMHDFFTLTLQRTHFCMNHQNHYHEKQPKQKNSLRTNPPPKCKYTKKDHPNFMVLTNLQLYNLPKNNTGVISSIRGTRTEVNVSFVKSCVMASGSNLEGVTWKVR